MRGRPGEAHRDGALAAGGDRRVHALFDYYRENGDKDTTAIYAADPEAVTPTVANEDAVWELMTGYDEAMMRLLRIVTAEITSSLDVPGCC